MTKHPSRPPDVEAILTALIERDVRFVLTGSVAARFYGADVDPGDLDITPALDPDNLQCLGELLIEMEAQPPLDFGRWEVQDDGERKWVVFEPTPEQLEAKKNWKPDPANVEGFDSLFHTRLGNFDVVPELSGTYEELMKRAVVMQHAGRPLHVMHVDALLAALTVPRRAKDVERVRALRRAQGER